MRQAVAPRPRRSDVDETHFSPIAREWAGYGWQASGPEARHSSSSGVSAAMLLLTGVAWLGTQNAQPVQPKPGPPALTPSAPSLSNGPAQSLPPAQLAVIFESECCTANRGERQKSLAEGCRRLLCRAARHLIAGRMGEALSVMEENVQLLNAAGASDYIDRGLLVEISRAMQPMLNSLVDGLTDPLKFDLYYSRVAALLASLEDLGGLCR